MKKISIIILGIMISATSFAQQVNDPNAVIRKVENFHGINISSAFNVYLSQSNEDAVAVSASNIADRDMIRTEVKDGVLFISFEKNSKWNSGNKKLKAYISFKNIDKLKISGACDVFIVGSLKSDELDIHLNGASDFKGKIEVKSLSVELSGASDLKLSGTVNNLKTEASGASSFKGYDLIADYCFIKASGASGIRITVNKELSAVASGASDIEYKGDAVIKDLKSSGASSISKSR
jgi:hypothetical protein